MKLWSIFAKSLIEQVRNPLVLLLTLAFAPFFVLMIWLFFPSGGSTTYEVLVVNQDVGVTAAGVRRSAGEDAIAAIRAVSYENGSPMLTVELAADVGAAERALRDRKAVVYIVLPADFSQQIAEARAGHAGGGIDLTFGGDLTNPYYPVAAILATSAVDDYVRAATLSRPLLQYREQPIGSSGARTEFEVYVPGILIFAIGMLVFGASMSVAREVESGTLRRLLLTRLRAVDLLGGISLAQITVGLGAELLAFVTAVALGFRSTGPLWVAVLIGALTSLTIVGLGMFVAAISRSVAQAFIIANFPFALFMFLSGAMFPIQGIPLFDAFGHSINVLDVLPTRHAVIAMNKVLTLGAGLGDVTYELGALLLLSLLYFALGVWTFQRRHLHVA